MKEITVTLEADTVDPIVKQQLSEVLDSLESDLARRKSNTGFAIFEHDPELDMIEIKRHCDAVQLILSYYGHDK